VYTRRDPSPFPTPTRCQLRKKEIELVNRPVAWVLPCCSDRLPHCIGSWQPTATAREVGIRAAWACSPLRGCCNGTPHTACALRNCRVSSTVGNQVCQNTRHSNPHKRQQCEFSGLAWDDLGSDQPSVESSMAMARPPFLPRSQYSLMKDSSRHVCSGATTFVISLQAPYGGGLGECRSSPGELLTPSVKMTVLPCRRWSLNSVVFLQSPATAVIVPQFTPD
jgi:hypothetical protein